MLPTLGVCNADEIKKRQFVTRGQLWDRDRRQAKTGGGGQGMRRGQWDVRAAVIKSAFVVECLIAHRVRAKVTTALAPRPMCAPLGTLSVACHRRQHD